MPVYVFVSKTADAVDLFNRFTIAVNVPGVLVYEVVVDERVGNIGVNSLGRLIANGFLHTMAHGFAGGPPVCMGTGAAHLLGVASTMESIEEIGDAVMHQPVYLLHAALGAVVVEINP